jgi:ligand-binding sensor domain-containing protein
MNRLIWVILSLFAAGAAAQAPAEKPSQPAPPRVTHLGHNGDIRAICRVGDSLWVGTSGGLYIYDLGSSGFAGHVGVGDALAGNSVRAIAARNDTVFVGTDEGLSLFHGGKVDVFTPARPGPFAGMPIDRIRRIDFGVRGQVYVSTYGSGLGVLSEGSAHAITREDSLLDDKVYGTVQEDDTTFYYATSMGLCAFRDSVWVNFQAGAGIPRAEVRQIERAPDGGYYLLVAGRGVYRFDGEQARRVTVRGLFEQNDVAAIAMDASGNLWACGRHGEIAAYRNGHWTEADQDRRRWRSAYADGTGSVFFGSADGAVLSIRDNVTKTVDLPPGLPSGRVTEIVADSNGVVYALNGSYLLRFTDGLENVTVEHPSPVVVGLAVAPDGGVWSATRWGIYQKTENEYVEFTNRPAERSPVFTAIGFGPAGGLWAGTAHGAVHRFDGLIWMRLADPGELGVGAIAAFRPHPDGGMWVVGSEGGIARYRGGSWDSFGPAAFGEQPAQDLAVSPAGIPVIVTSANILGYDEINGWKPVTFASADGDSTAGIGWDPAAPAANVIRFDAEGRLYVGTDKGVAVIEPAGVRWLTVADGLRGEAVSGLFVDSQSALWVGFRSDGIARVQLENGGEI